MTNTHDRSSLILLLDVCMSLAKLVLNAGYRSTEFTRVRVRSTLLYNYVCTCICKLQQGIGHDTTLQLNRQ